jgi:hypothetical protein
MLAPDELAQFVSRLEASGVTYMVTGATAARYRLRLRLS